MCLNPSTKLVKSKKHSNEDNPLNSNQTLSIGACASLLFL